MKRKIFLVIIFGLFAFSATSTLACQPVFSRHTKYFREAKSVFIGKVVNVALDNSQNADRNFPYKIKFAVEKSWKGNKSEIEIISDNGLPPCGQVEFRIGERYLVYAFKEEKDLFVYTYVGNRSRLIGFDNEREYQKKEFAELDSFWFRLKSRLWLF